MWVCINKICIFLESYAGCIFQIKAGLSDLNKSLALQENLPGTPSMILPEASEDSCFFASILGIAEYSSITLKTCMQQLT